MEKSYGEKFGTVMEQNLILGSDRRFRGRRCTVETVLLPMARSPLFTIIIFNFVVIFQRIRFLRSPETALPSSGSQTGWAAMVAFFFFFISIFLAMVAFFFTSIFLARPC